MKNIIILLILVCTGVFAQENATEFFLKEAKLKEKVYRFNSYETVAAGGVAFLIGNIGFYTTTSSVLKLGYSGVQTIGIINFGRGIYEINSPTMEKDLYDFMKMHKGTQIDKNDLSGKLIQIFGQEERAKRMGVFYGSALLSGQYLINAFVGDTNKELKKIYMFLGGVNAIVMSYAAFNKGNYEKKVYGEGIDLRPVAFEVDQKVAPGVFLTYQF